MNPPHLHTSHTAASTSAAVDNDRQVLQIRFTGQGRDYFWIWAGNLLRLLVTLGLYYPFAQARRRRYFYAHTLVDGHALAYHGGPGWPLRAVAGVLFCALALACALLFGLALLPTRADTTARQSPAVAGAVAVVLLVTLWPALWQAALRHRLANTSWRGLRLRFTGDVAGAYRALLPQWLPAALLLVLLSVPTPQTRHGAAAVQWVAGLTGLAMLAMLPLTLARSKRYQHDHCQFAAEHSRLRAPTGAFYRLALGLGLAGLGLLLLVAAAPAAAIGSVTVALVGCGLLLVVLAAFALASLQNLVWGRTRSARMRFDSQLDPWRLVAMALRHAVLMLLTLGFYRPFAVVHSARLRLQAMQVVVRGDPAQWLGGPTRLAPDRRHVGGTAASGHNSAH